MKKHPQFQRLMFLFAISGLIAATANYACLPEVCADSKTAEFTSMDELNKYRVATLNEALRSGSEQSSPSAQNADVSSKLTHPVKLPDGSIQMPADWLPAIPEGHPWASALTPSDDAFYSFFEERIVRARLFDPSNPQHVEWAQAYLAKSRSNHPEFVGWTYANRTECSKILYDAAGTMGRVDARL